MRLLKNKLVFYLLSFTWGLPMTAVGLLAAAVLLISGKRAHKHGPCIHFRTGKSWGGMSLGFVILTSELASAHTCDHEVGHSLQNCLWGPLMLPVVCIPSAVRYWLFRLMTARGRTPKHEYDDIWFEGQATRWGSRYMNNN